MPIRISAVAYGSAPYHDMLALRRRLLRMPLGLVLTEAQLEAEQDQVHLALWHDDVVSGTLLLVPPDAAGVAKLRQMAVASELQGRGLGAALVRRAEAMLRQPVARRIELSARETVIGFYERLGYRVEGEPFIEVTVAHRRMGKTL